MRPDATYNGKIGDDLYIYLTPLLLGVPGLYSLALTPEMDESEEANHVRYARSLARYFASKLEKVCESPGHSFLNDTINEIELELHNLSKVGFLQVLTHGDLSQTNILPSKQDLSITGIVDWSFASVLPFGMELDIIRLTTGNMDLHG